MSNTIEFALIDRLVKTGTVVASLYLHHCAQYYIGNDAYENWCNAKRDIQEALPNFYQKTPNDRKDADA